MTDQAYDVGDLVDSLKEQLASAAVRAALAEARLKQAQQERDALQVQLDRALESVTEQTPEA